MVVPYPRRLPPWDTSAREVRAALTGLDQTFVETLVRKTAFLIENAEVRWRLGQAAREQIERGKFSLERKNRCLKVIFDEAADHR